ncbi:MAG: ABC transporter permease [Gemmatales bacterium]
MRWSIVRTLLWKEVLRFRYNWGLLLMVGAVLAMSALVSLGERMGQIPGQSARGIKAVLITIPPHPELKAWGAALLSSPPSWFTEKNKVPIYDISKFNWSMEPGLVHPDDYLEIRLRSAEANVPWKVEYYFRAPNQGEAMQYRLWVSQVTQKLRGSVALSEKLPTFTTEEKAAEDRIPKIVTALVIFAFYLLSFNLYITSTAEEREKKSLLALMLSPARPIEVIGAKVIFYSLSSLFVATGVVALFDPMLLAQPLLWSTILAGSISYVSIGTVVLCIVRLAIDDQHRLDDVPARHRPGDGCFGVSGAVHGAAVHDDRELSFPSTGDDHQQTAQPGRADLSADHVGADSGMVLPFGVHIFESGDAGGAGKEVNNRGYNHESARLVYHFDHGGSWCG